MKMNYIRRLLEFIKSYFKLYNIKSKTIIYINTTKSKGLFNKADHINQSVYEDFIKQYKSLKNDEDFTININTLGGDLFYASLITNILFNHKGKIHCVIDNYAMSAGSLIALSCNTIEMTCNDIMGPIDPQLFSLIPVKDIVNLNFKDTLFESLLFNISDGVIKGYKFQLNKILLKYHTSEIVDRIISLFFDSNNRHHSSIITYSDIKEILGESLILK
jgi:hypothetical protein